MEERKFRIVSDCGSTLDIYTIIRVIFWAVVICFGLAIGAGYYYFLS
jgi:hypothetical protein